MCKIRRHNELSPIISLVLVFFLLLQSCSGLTTKQSLKLNIIHLNDTHSHLEPDSVGVNMVFDGIEARAFLGGFSRVKSAVDYIKNTHPHNLFVHAGDAVQGTLFFTKFKGDADIDFLNLLGIDAMTFGNHEFDLGTIVLKKFAQRANFDLVSTNIDLSSEPEINHKVKPYLIKHYDNQPVAIIGVSTEETPTISSPGPTIKFKNVIDSLKKTVREIESKGINKIILLSHIGYEADKIVAKEVKGIDVIVGGHSHTLLGDGEFKSVGLKPEGDYPTVINKDDGDVVLIVQAWKWGQTLGVLMVNFDEDGKVAGYEPNQLLLLNDRFVQNKQDIPPDSETYKKIIASILASKSLKVFPENPDALKLLAPLKAQIDELKRQVLTVAQDDLIIGLNSGAGPLVADSYVKKLNADVGLVNRGSVRKNLYAGNVTLGDVYEILPFGNTVCLAYLKGSEIKQALEDGIDYQLTRNPSDPYYPYVSGMTYTVNPRESKGSRVYSIMKKRPDGTFEPLEDDKVYKFVSTNFVALQGGDGFRFFNTYKGNIIDTGLVDAEVFAEFLSTQSSIKNPTEERIKIDTSEVKPFVLVVLYNEILRKNRSYITY